MVSNTTKKIVIVGGGFGGAYTAQSLEKTMRGQDVEIIHEVDADLIGGAMIRVGDHVIDASLKGQLHRLAQQMIH